MPRSAYYEMKAEVYDPLVYPDKEDKDQKIFSSYKDLFMLAVVIGFKHHRKKWSKFQGGKNKGEIKWEFFRDNKQDMTIINSIAVLHTNDINIILNNEDNINEKISILEGYADLGIKDIYLKVMKAPGDPYDNLLNFIHSELNHKDLELSVLEEMEKEI